LKSAKGKERGGRLIYPHEKLVCGKKGGNMMKLIQMRKKPIISLSYFCGEGIFQGRVREYEE